MSTFTASATLPEHISVEALGAAMERLTPAPIGVDVFEIEDGRGNWEVCGYFSTPPDELGLALLASAFGAAQFRISKLPDENWVSKVENALHPIEVGRFFVYGSHDKNRIPADRFSLLIDASMAFGTGHHATTRGCLMAFDRLVDQRPRFSCIADIGCGTAILAMAAARACPKAQIYASDMDPTAVEIGGTNISQNGLEQQITCVTATGFDHPTLASAAPFDLIFANILKGPLIELAPILTKNMSKGGYAIVSGILDTQADEVIATYHKEGVRVEKKHILGEWITLTLKKPNILSKQN